MTNQIELIKHYFNRWLTKNQSDLNTVFIPNAHYIECYGAEYNGIDEIKQWMVHKFKVQTVTQWDIKHIYHDGDIYTVEWLFACLDNGKKFKFDGVSLITFRDGLIAEVKEFESKHQHYRPYK
jgi:ketosteroid isomerase-like protein